MLGAILGALQAVALGLLNSGVLAGHPKPGDLAEQALLQVAGLFGVRLPRGILAHIAAWMILHRNDPPPIATSDSSWPLADLVLISEPDGTFRLDQVPDLEPPGGGG